MNSGGSIRIYGSSLPTNWHRTLSTSYSAFKPAPLKEWVISKATRAVGSKSREVGRCWMAYGVQLTYNDTRLEEGFPKGSAWKSMKIKTLELTSSKVNPARWALTRGNSFRIRSVPRVMRPYLTIHRCKRKHKPQTRCKMTVCKMKNCKMTNCKITQFAKQQATSENERNGKKTNFKELPRPYKLP